MIPASGEACPSFGVSGFSGVGRFRSGMESIRWTVRFPVSVSLPHPGKSPLRTGGKHPSRDSILGGPFDFPCDLFPGDGPGLEPVAPLRINRDRTEVWVMLLGSVTATSRPQPCRSLNRPLRPVMSISLQSALVDMPPRHAETGKVRGSDQGREKGGRGDDGPEAQYPYPQYHGGSSFTRGPASPPGSGGSAALVELRLNGFSFREQ